MKKKKSEIKIEDNKDIDIIIPNKLNENEVNKDNPKSKVNNKKKSIIITILLTITIILTIVFIFTITDYLQKRNESYSIKKEINNYNELINNTNITNKEIETALEKIKEESKNKVEEYEIWQDIKAKINKAIS